MDPKLTSLEVLGMAIRSEEDAARFYGHIARMIDNDLVRAKYEHLAREEVIHKKMLAVLYRKMTGSQERPPKIPGEPETAEGGPVPEDISESLVDLLQLAVKREQEARDFYRKAAVNATDPSGRRIFEYLANVEKGHETMLEQELEACLRDKDWYVSQQPPELVHVGP